MAEWMFDKLRRKWPKMHRRRVLDNTPSGRSNSRLFQLSTAKMFVRFFFRDPDVEKLSQADRNGIWTWKWRSNPKNPTFSLNSWKQPIKIFVQQNFIRSKDASWNFRGDKIFHRSTQLLKLVLGQYLDFFSLPLETVTRIFRMLTSQ